jgi:hypothetical protein
MLPHTIRVCWSGSVHPIVSGLRPSISAATTGSTGFSEDVRVGEMLAQLAKRNLKGAERTSRAIATAGHRRASQ